MKNEENQLKPEAGARSSEDRNLLGKTLQLLSGPAAAQVLRALLSPIIARFFPPAALGIAQNYSAIGKTSAVLATLRYEESIQLPEDDESAFQQMIIALCFVCINSLLSLLLLLFIRHPIAAFLNAPKLGNLFLSLPLFILARGCFLAFRSWHIRKESYQRVSGAALMESGLWDGGAAGLGLLGLAGSATLTGTQLVGQAGAAIFLGTPIIKEKKRIQLNWQAILAGIRKYRKFPIFNTWSKLLDNMALYLPAFLLSAFFSPATAGQFTIGFNLLQLPFSMIANSVGHVLYQQAPEAQKNNSLINLVSSLLTTIIKIGILPVILFAINGLEIITLIFGPKWETAGFFVRILSPWMLFLFLSLTIERLPSILNRNENILVFQGLNTCMRIIAVSIGALTKNVYLSIILLSIGGCLVYGANILWVTNLIGLKSQKLLQSLLSGVLFSMPYLMALIGLKFLFFSRPDLLAILSIVVSGAAFAGLAIFDTQIRQLFSAILKKK